MKRAALPAVLSRLPHRLGGRTILYAVGFADGRVKFGKSYAPRSRLLTVCRHDSAEPAWVHLFGPITPSPLGANSPEEVAAWAAAKRMGAYRVGRSETFGGLTRAQAIACGREARAAKATA